MSYLSFEQVPSDHLKTDVWIVRSTSPRALGIGLGEVRWYSRWRQYCFFPSETTVFNPDCLREIADFAAKLTTEHRAGARA